MGTPSLIGGDWGTSHCRLFLYDREGSVLDRVNGPGAAQSSGRFESIFAGLTLPWRERYGDLPTVLCGMVGSSIGWAEAPYVPCPADPAKIAEACVTIGDGSVQLVPGLSCRNRFGAPDVLRGEETQILGVLDRHPELRRGRQLLCLPGTHTKWVSMRAGAVEDFLTAPTGEFYAVLRAHSVMLRDAPDVETAADSDAFAAGLTETARHPQASLLHRLFECRSRRVSGEYSASAAADFLSGLLIANDVSGALKLFADSASDGTVHFIGAPNLTALYTRALTFLQYRDLSYDGADASISGLLLVHRYRSALVVTNALG